MIGRAPLTIERVADIPSDFSIDSVPRMEPPRGVLTCAPSHYDVIDVKNPFMAGHAGTVDRAAASRQWNDLRTAFARAGAAVVDIPPIDGCEDMVFSANPALFGLDADGVKTCAPSRMT